MDVTCERCGTEYEFDETLVSDRGTTVKCTNCGHLFKVHRPGARPQSEAAKSWTVRKRDGNTVTLSSLRDLQKLIARGELVERDMISRAGEGWKRLGDIAELSSFFTAAKSSPPARAKDPEPAFQRTPTSRPAPNQPAAPPAGVVAETHPYSREQPATTPESPILRGAPIAEPPRAPPPARTPTPLPPIRQAPPAPVRDRRQMTLVGVGDADAAPIPAPRPAPPPPVSDGAQTTPMQPVGNAGAVLDRQSGERAGTRPLGGSGVPAARAPAARAVTPTRVDPPAEVEPIRSTPKFRAAAEPTERTRTSGHANANANTKAGPSKRPKLHVDEDDEPARKRGGSGGKTVALVALILLAGAGAGVGLAWDRIAPLVGIQTGRSGVDAVAPMLEEAQAELARDDAEGYERAVEVLTRASALSEDDARVMALLAQTHAAWAQSIAFEADDVEARAGAEAVATLRAQQNRKTEEAKRSGEAALSKAPNDVRALIALANALRLARDVDGAEQKLAQAQQLEGRSNTSAEWLYVSALVAMTRGSNVAAARSGAGQAVLRDPALLRAQLLYARALAADGERAQAVAALDQVLQRQPGHGPATRLRAMIAEAADAGVESDDAALVAEADAGTTVAANTAVADASGPAAPQENGQTNQQTSTPRDYSTLVRRGNDAVEEGNVGQARRLFEEAIRQRPGGPEASTGLGYIALNARDIERAIGYFQPAANRGFADALLGLGEAYRQSGRRQQALEAYRSYLQRSPNGREANVARRQVSQLEEELGVSTPPPGPGASAGPGAGPESGSASTTPPPGPGTTGPGTGEPGGTTETPPPPDNPTPPPGPGAGSPVPEGNPPSNGNIDFTVP